jgi:IS5 family transposase
MKDIDTRWTEKGGQKFYGYKDHAKIDSKSKLIDTYTVTSASVQTVGHWNPCYGKKTGSRNFTQIVPILAIQHVRY